MLSVVQRMIVHSYHPLIRSVAEILITLRSSIVTMRKRRKDRGHLWTYEEIMFLLGEYLTLKTSSAREDQIPPIQTFRARGTWFPMAFRRQFWPGQELLKRNGLTKWLKAIPGNIDLEKFVAPIFARMFLEDRTILPQGFSNAELFAAIYGPLCRDAWRLAAQRGGLGPSPVPATFSRCGGAEDDQL
ncbi:uncharacterized protein N7473_013148 [Penicillium subrubescens]|uniref:uncharacterized protein n=1 Tax=Penicillium subrubescens TaxID=1316194 RepID=UPI002544DB65|nr:uncharacterized protein N7473_013148 [Penicillium subrubescens]KAJ5873589.1 hypothetical protein N7473_013148 [Penicillium subrubescens]